MATARAPLVAPLWSRSVAEWALLGLVIVALVWVFGRQVRAVQVQGERAAVQAMLGTLRTALVLSRVTAHLGTPDAAQSVRVPPGAARNPFLLLEKMPANYAGEVAMAQTLGMVPGTWAFDGACACIGYRLLYPEGLDVPPDAGAVWFRVEGLAGPLQIKGLLSYVWQGQVVN